MCIRDSGTSRRCRARRRRNRSSDTVAACDRSFSNDLALVMLWKRRAAGAHVVNLFWLRSLLCVTLRRQFPSPNLPFTVGDLNLRLIHGSLERPNHHQSKRHFDRIRRWSTILARCQRYGGRTDRQNDDGTRPVATHRLYAMRPRNKQSFQTRRVTKNSDVKCM